jgi:DNA topoisomerase-1
LNIRGILEKLSTSVFSKETQEIIEHRRKQPTRGKKQTTDHPPIHPVGVPTTMKLSADYKTLYELVVRRFLATLSEDAISETSNVSFDIGGEEFTASGYRLIKPSWKKIYPYFKEKRKALPELNQGETIPISRLQVKKDKTKPQKRYDQGSLLAKMEQLSLGTKSTRPDIIQKLYSRKYVTGSPLKPTSLARAVIDSLQCYNVIKPTMTAVLEKDMNAIAEGQKTLDETVSESRQMLAEVVKSLEEDKEKIRTSIKNAFKEQNTVGPCPKCGKNLVLRVSKKGKRFVGCTGYPDCKNTYSLPQKGFLTLTDKTCNKCQAPIVTVKIKGKKPWNLCINPECPGKK